METTDLGQTETVTLRVPSRTHYLSLVGACAVEICRRLEYLPNLEQATYDVQLAVNEAVVNAIEHAYAGSPGGLIEILFHLHPDRLAVDVVDWGQDFDFGAVPEPTLTQALENGYGIMLMHKLMDTVTYESDAVQGNRLRMVKEVGRLGNDD